MFSILHALAIFVVNLFKSRNRLEAENLFLRHELNLALRQAPSRLKFHRTTSSATPDIFNDAKHPLPQTEELLDAGWPVSRERLSRAILAMALKQGGCDLADGATVNRANLNKREYHHLFPDAHLTRLGLPDDRIYLSLNCALVTWQTNRNIRDKSPERYLAERRDGISLGDSEIQARLATHLIPFDEMVKNDYEAFLAKRASMMHDAMNKLCTTGGT
jgi:hypothetical protein